MDKKSILKIKGWLGWFLGWFEFLTPKKMDSNFTVFQNGFGNFPISFWKMSGPIFCDSELGMDEFQAPGGWAVPLVRRAQEWGFRGRWKNRSQDELWKIIWTKASSFFGGLWGTCIEKNGIEWDHCIPFLISSFQHVSYNLRDFHCPQPFSSFFRIYLTSLKLIDWRDFLEAFPTFFRTSPDGKARALNDSAVWVRQVQSPESRVKSQRFERRWCFCWAFRLHHSLLGRPLALSCERVGQQGAAAKTTMGIGSTLEQQGSLLRQHTNGRSQTPEVITLSCWSFGRCSLRGWLVHCFLQSLPSKAAGFAWSGHRPDLLRPSKAARNNDSGRLWLRSWR